MTAPWTVTFSRLEAASGRLGNQLWQIAATVGIAQRLDAQPRFPRRWSYRRWFSLHDEWFASPRGATIEATDTSLVDHIDPAARLYLQDAGLLFDAGDIVRAAFAPSDAAVRLMGERVPRLDDYLFDVVAGGAVALHVRRGDLLTQTPGHQPVLSVDYYRDALRLAGDVPCVWVFSDEPEWCELELPRLLELDVPVHVMRSTPARSHQQVRYRREPALDWVDLQLMARARRHIIANSTYAWWAAWLSDDPAPIYPQQWHGPQRAHIDASLMFPDHWQMVPC